jgi:hypothetical protein
MIKRISASILSRSVPPFHPCPFTLALCGLPALQIPWDAADVTGHVSTEFAPFLFYFILFS